LPNYRGSDDLGTAHEHAIYQDPGAGPMSDVMAGLAVIERRGTINTARECIGGHSYGGEMTAWIVGHDTRWRCAVLGDAAVDWVEAYDLSGTGNLAWSRDSLGGSPWQSDAMMARYREDSPITYARSVRTPTLILTGLADQVVPFTESWAFYHALRENRVPVRLVGIPTAHHTPRDPVRHLTSRFASNSGRPPHAKTEHFIPAANRSATVKSFLIGLERRFFDDSGYVTYRRRPSLPSE
jgi:dipeptidyl aminopeptidase/acylaminoacyl peptidase